MYLFPNEVFKFVKPLLSLRTDEYHGDVEVDTVMEFVREFLIQHVAFAYGQYPSFVQKFGIELCQFVEKYSVMSHYIIRISWNEKEQY